MMTVQETAALLRQWDRCLILTHVRPDGDAVGCAGALCLGLRRLGKTAYLCPNPELTDTTRPYAESLAAPADFAPDFVISVDIATRGLLPKNAAQYEIDLAIDHHASFESIGRHNILRVEAAACGELIYDILMELGVMDAEIANDLYLAISTDTGGFIYTNTTARTHAIAASLMEAGADIHPINKTFFRTKSRRRMTLEAEMLTAAQYYDGGRVVLLSVPMSLMERIGATETDAEDLSSLGPQIEGVDCAVTFRELKKDTWKLSVRTAPGRNASAICALFGGGGHAAAAGCTIPGTFDQVAQRLLDAVAQVCPDFRR